MKKPLHTVTDHAVIRYLERVEGVDIDAVRRVIGHKVDTALELGACAALVGGFRYVIAGGRVVTVHPQHLPDKRFGNGKGGDEG